MSDSIFIRKICIKKCWGFGKFLSYVGIGKCNFLIYLSDITEITFGPMDQKWSFFNVHFWRKSICNHTSSSATFGRGISDEMILYVADDIGVRFFGLKVCNFRRILLFKYPILFQDDWNIARDLQTLILLSFHFILFEMWSKTDSYRFVDN